MRKLILCMPTDQIVTLDGVECRLWRGCDPQGHRLDMFVHRVGTADLVIQSWLDDIALPRADPGEVK